MARALSAARRRMYEHHRPNRVASVLARGTALLASAGLAPARLVTLEVTGRRTGRRRSFPVVVADYEGERYLVAMLGQGANWPSNVEAAGGHAVLKHGGREHVRLTEVPATERAPILRRYLQLAPGARPHIEVGLNAPIEDYEAIAADYPVFRIST